MVYNILFSQKQQYGELLWIGNSKFQLPFRSVYYKRAGNYDIPQIIRLPFSERSELLCIKSLSSLVPHLLKIIYSCYRNGLNYIPTSPLPSPGPVWSSLGGEDIHSCLPFLKGVWICWDTVEEGGIAAESAPGRRFWRGQDGWYYGWAGGAGNWQLQQHQSPWWGTGVKEPDLGENGKGKSPGRRNSCCNHEISEPLA